MQGLSVAGGALFVMFAGLAGWFLVLIAAASCASPDTQRVPDGHIGFTFSAVIRNIDPTVDMVNFDGSSYEIADQQVTIVKEFATYDDGLAAGPLAIDFVAGGAVVQSGTLAVGACTSCAASFCPALSALESEQIEYSEITHIAPDSYICFTCAGGGALAKACP